MFSICETPDFMYPMTADIYYPKVSQGAYGEVTKTWAFDRTIVCNATSLGGLGEEEIKPQNFLQYENKLIARSKTDLRFSKNDSDDATTNILVANIKDKFGNLIYKETAGPRAGQGTIYEVATLEPYTGPFGTIEFYKMLWRKTEVQNFDGVGLSQ